MDQFKVAVINTSKEIVEVLQELFESEGYKTCGTFTYLYKGNESHFDEFIEQNKPDVIIYDIALPYKDNFELFKKLSEKMKENHIPFILTTTNKVALESIVGKTNTHELVGKPYDMQEIVDAVHRALKEKNEHSAGN
jgi:DNA-binding response OmpR family regulator